MLLSPSISGALSLARAADLAGVSWPQMRDILREQGVTSVHRLTTGAIDVPIGATPAELRDTLCPITPPPNASAEDVERVIRIALRQIERTVNNQFLSRNESGQYYLDLKKSDVQHALDGYKRMLEGLPPFTITLLPRA